MSYAMIDQIAYMFFQLLGDGTFMVLFLTGLVCLILMAAKVTSPFIYLSVISPMLIGFILNKWYTNYINIESWILFPILIIYAIIVGTVIFSINKDG